MLRVNNGVLVVPPFECAWLTGDGYTLRSGSGCVCFEAKGDTDVTVILKSTPGAKRLQPLLRQAPGTGQGQAGGGNALQVEQNYTIIFGSHRNSCLKIEKNGVTQCMVTGVACSRVSNKTFSKYWIDLNHGVLTVGHGEPGQGVCHQWRDSQEIPGIQHIGLSCWDRHVSYRDITLQPPLDFTRLQQAQLSGAACAVPSLFDATVAAIMAATTPANVCRTLHVAELLLPTTQKLYRYCLDYIARHFETVVGARLEEPLPSAQPAAEPAPVVGLAEQEDRDTGPALLTEGAGSGSPPDPGLQQLGAEAEAEPQQQEEEQQALRQVSAAAMCDLVCQNTFSVDEGGIFAAVRDWAAAYLASHAAEPDGERMGQRDGRRAGMIQEEQEQDEDDGDGHAGGGEGTKGRAARHLVCGSQSSGGKDQGEGHPPRNAAAAVLGSSHLLGPDTGAGAKPDQGMALTAAAAMMAAAAATPVPPGTPPLFPALREGSNDGHIGSCRGGVGTSTTTTYQAARRASFGDIGVWPSGISSAIAHVGGAHGHGHRLALAPSATAAAEDAVCRVLTLIRFPLLPIATLQRCLADPLLLRLPAVVELVGEALEVHRRETGAGIPGLGGADAPGAAPVAGDCGSSHSAPLATVVSQGVGGGVAAAGGAPGSAGCTRSTSLQAPPAERRLVKPAGVSVGVHDGGVGAGGVAAGAAAAGGGTGGVGGGCSTAAGGASGAGGGHAGAAAAGGDSGWSVRFQRRCLPFAVELTYVCDGDNWGVLHFLGTQYSSQGWVNPVLAKRVDVRASSPTGRTTDPRAIVGRQFVRTNFAGPRYVNGAAVSWWQVDLGEPHQLAITYYTLRHDGSPDFARSWVLQGSNDLTTWVDLKRHTHDTTIKVPGQYASWPVIGPAAAVPYRAFRLLLTGPNASPNATTRYNFCLSNLELYGFLHKGGGATNGSSSTGSSSSSSSVGAIRSGPSAVPIGSNGTATSNGSAVVPSSTVGSCGRVSSVSGSSAA